MKYADSASDAETRPFAFPPEESGGMFPLGATFLCQDWKAARLRPKIGKAADAFRRVALPRLLARSGIHTGAGSFRARTQTVPYGSCGIGVAGLDLEATLERILPALGTAGSVEEQPLRPEDILVRFRPDPAMRLLVMLDTSLSMSGLNRAVSAVIGAVLARQSPSGGLALIVFHSEPNMLIRFGERVKPLEAAYRVLASPVGGITNISAALKHGASVLAGCRTRSAHAVLTTDGENTAGPDPCDEAKKFRRLHVVLVGLRNTTSSRELARLGRGLWRQVDRLDATPPILLRLLQQVCKD